MADVVTTHPPSAIAGGRLTPKSIAAGAALWGTLALLAETQAANLAVALAWSIALGVLLLYGQQAFANMTALVSVKK